MHTKIINNKPRLLFSSEGSFLKTGFSKITNELLKRLHKNGHIEVAELASYVDQNDPRIRMIPWRVYPCNVNDPRIQQRASSNDFHRVYNQFGSAALDYAMLDFKPDVVFNIRDPWMSSLYEIHSPYLSRSRNPPLSQYFLCPTIDGLPQRSDWMQSYILADKLFTYSEFGKRALIKHDPSIQIHGVMRPGVDHEVFVPVSDKAEHRKSMGIAPDANIILTVMRNQKRKLYPDLIEAFSKFLQLCVKNGNKELAQKSYLYMHTSFMDVGYDIQYFVNKYGVAHKCLFTYVCKHCNNWCISHAHTEIQQCGKCGNFSSITSNTSVGIDEASLCKIYNLADVFVSYAICEGLSMPSVECRSCEVPLLAVDYSAVEDQAHEPGGQPIKVKEMMWETMIETEQARAVPDKDDLVKKLYNFFMKSPKEREVIGKAGRKYVSENYSFDRAANMLEEAILSTDFPDHSLTWDNPVPKYCPMNQNVPRGLNPSELVDWCIDNILGQAYWKDTYWRDSLVKAVTTGAYNLEGSRRMVQFGPKELVDMMMQRAQEYNHFESLRVNMANRGFASNKQEFSLVGV